MYSAFLQEGASEPVLHRRIASADSSGVVRLLLEVARRCPCKSAILAA
jgi:hypothetical protein